MLPSTTRSGPGQLKRGPHPINSNPKTLRRPRMPFGSWLADITERSGNGGGGKNGRHLKRAWLTRRSGRPARLDPGDPGYHRNMPGGPHKSRDDPGLPINNGSAYPWLLGGRIVTGSLRGSGDGRTRRRPRPRVQRAIPWSRAFGHNCAMVFSARLCAIVRTVMHANSAGRRGGARHFQSQEARMLPAATPRGRGLARITRTTGAGDPPIGRQQ